jgi:hypothetical protein
MTSEKHLVPKPFVMWKLNQKNVPNKDKPVLLEHMNNTNLFWLMGRPWKSIKSRENSENLHTIEKWLFI